MRRALAAAGAMFEGKRLLTVSRPYTRQHRHSTGLKVRESLRKAGPRKGCRFVRRHRARAQLAERLDRYRAIARQRAYHDAID